MEPVWMGPYIISRDLGKGLYELTPKAGKVIKKNANISRLKKYKERKLQIISFIVVRNNYYIEPIFRLTRLILVSFPRFNHLTIMRKRIM